MPSFYCETCGHEVPAEVQECPFCGKRFYSVICPVCSFSGKASLFTSGCPSCGYLGVSENAGRTTAGKKRNKRGKEFPRWVYTLTLFILLAAMGVLVKLYFSL